jgi:uncharacterized protein
MKNGFRIIDSDMHIIEPPETWEKYIDGAFKDRAPKIVGHYPIGTYGLMEGHMLPAVDSQARERWNGMFRVVEPHLQTDAARGFDAIAQVAAMDREGVDLAALFPTIGLYVMSFDGLDPAFAAAVCRAYNNWLHTCPLKPGPSRTTMLGHLTLGLPHALLALRMGIGSTGQEGTKRRAKP